MNFDFMPALALALCFGPPQTVEIVGYDDHVMEPFLSRDGQSLFFNSRNGPTDQTDIFWASRIDDTHFRYRGAVTGANSTALDGVPSLARDGTFAHISPRPAGERVATVWISRWNGEAVQSPKLQSMLTPGPWPLLSMDAEISADGHRLYVSETRWASPVPEASDLHLSVQTDGSWRRAPEFDRWFASVNTSQALEYAPATSTNELELYFTRLTPHFFAPPTLEIMVATRGTADDAFGAPSRIAAIDGVVEAPTVAPDGAIYFHARIRDRYTLMRAARACPASPQPVERRSQR